MPVLYRRSLRGPGGNGVAWTELDLAIPAGLLQLTLRPRLDAVPDPLMEIETGDLTFDALFQVEAAPADVTRELLDADLRAAFVRMGGPWVVPIEGGLRLARPGWADPIGRAELIALATLLVTRIESAYLAADRHSRALCGSSAAMAESSPPVVSAENGNAPVRSSYRMTPSAQTSVRTSTFLALRICSGDMYAGDPKTDAVCVIEGFWGVPSPSALEIPKSSTLTTEGPSSRCVRNRFDGLRSRWTIPSA